MSLQLLLLEMIKYSLKWSHYSLNSHFEWEKLSVDDFWMKTWEREFESQRKKKPQIPRLIQDLMIYFILHDCFIGKSQS